MKRTSDPDDLIDRCEEPAPKAPGDRASGGDQPDRVALTAVAPDGSPYFRGRVPDQASSPAASSSSLPTAVSAPRGPSRVSFDVKPGKIQLRIAVEGAASQVIDSEIREINVPDLTSSQVVLGTPEFLRARTLKDFQQLKADPAAIPVAAREFSRTERVLVRVTAYGPANSTPAIKARLLNRAGQSMNDLVVTPGAGPGSPSQVDLPLSGLAPGDYIVEISAGDDSEAKELVGFHLTA